MARSITLTEIRQELGAQIGEGSVVGNLTSLAGSGSSATDTSRYDVDTYWANGWFQDRTVATGQIVRIQSWTQLTSTWTFFSPLVSPAANLDAYEVHRNLSFEELRRCVNRGISVCGPALRQLVRDETRTLTANTYQITPTTDATSTNVFFPGGVVQISYQYWVGQNTREWYALEKGGSAGWYYLDDYTIQLPSWVVDEYASNPLRLQGYGPIAARITSDLPNTVIGTMDDWAEEMLIWACTSEAWLMLAGKKTSGEQTTELANAKFADARFRELRSDWLRGLIVPPTVSAPISGGWRGE